MCVAGVDIITDTCAVYNAIACNNTTNYSLKKEQRFGSTPLTFQVVREVFGDSTLWRLQSIKCIHQNH